MTNFEYIKTMTENMFYEFITHNQINLDQCDCPARNICGAYDSCEAAFIAWLKAEHTEN